MAVSVKVVRTAKVTMVLDEREAAAIAVLIGNVGGNLDEAGGWLVRALRDIYTEMLRGGLTPPSFRDCFEIVPNRLGQQELRVKGSMRCPHGYIGCVADACVECLRDAPTKGDSHG